MGELLIFFAFFGTLLYFFPVFIYVESYVDIQENRAWFSVSAYRFLKFLGGYAQLDKEGVAVHITEKKAIFIPYDQMADTRKKFEVTKGFQLYRFHQVVETGGAVNPYGVLVAAAIQAASGGTFAYLKTKHPFLSLKNSTLLDEKPCLKLSIQTAFVFNGLVLTIALIKKILEAIINWIREKKLTASLKKQRSN